MAKRILLSYQERNKVFTIPEGARDLPYLKAEFLKAFNLIDDITVEVFFQKYDDEWDTFIDLEDSDILITKDKLKAVVSHNVSLQLTSKLEAGSVATSIISVRMFSIVLLKMVNCVLDR